MGYSSGGPEVRRVGETEAFRQLGGVVKCPLAPGATQPADQREVLLPAHPGDPPIRAKRGGEDRHRRGLARSVGPSSPVTVPGATSKPIPSRATTAP